MGALSGLTKGYSSPLLPEEFRVRASSPCIAEPCLQGVGQPRMTAVVPWGAWLALVLAGQAWGGGIKPRRAWHWGTCSLGAEEAGGADVIPRKSWGLHLSSQKEGRKAFTLELWSQVVRSTTGTCRPLETPNKVMRKIIPLLGASTCASQDLGRMHQEAREGSLTSKIIMLTQWLLSPLFLIPWAGLLLASI